MHRSMQSLPFLVSSHRHLVLLSSTCNFITQHSHSRTSPVHSGVSYRNQDCNSLWVIQSWSFCSNLSLSLHPPPANTWFSTFSSAKLFARDVYRYSLHLFSDLLLKSLHFGFNPHHCNEGALSNFSITSVFLYHAWQISGISLSWSWPPFGNSFHYCVLKHCHDFHPTSLVSLPHSLITSFLLSF